MPSQQTHYAWILDLIQVYLERKLAVEVLLNHSKSCPKEKLKCSTLLGVEPIARG